ncbi:MAG: hypothetical protein AB8G99_10405 [Planctomycetaceae bacterium]
MKRITKPANPMALASNPLHEQALATLYPIKDGDNPSTQPIKAGHMNNSEQYA